MKYLQLPSGCICCTVKGDLVLAIEKLCTDSKDVNKIIVECSGVSNPGEVAKLFWGDEGGDFKVMLNGVITFVDSGNFLKQIDKGDQVVREQVVMGDRVCVNKADVVEEGVLKEVERRVVEINSIAEIRRTVKGRCVGGSEEEEWWKWCLDIGGYGGGEGEGRFNWGKGVGVIEGGNDKGHLKGTGRHTVFVGEEGDGRSLHVDVEKLERWVGELLWKSGGEDVDERDGGEGYGSGDMKIYRIKGAFRGGGIRAYEEDDLGEEGGGGEEDMVHYRSQSTFIIQGVNDTFEIRKYLGSSGDGSGGGGGDGLKGGAAIVFIGGKLDKIKLEQGVRSCLLPGK
ncbi:hypothetical protein TrCOL_g5597 [Triparma columacea]|uniref:CobW/HypB/UreG nucleotide-binding domain-containing protein n=1 Tax=Triparma columacea TaxID=722753 RepID=A0A9W7GGR6_9STRA|nr:hypothetical protein TrCOL_g5597 [Triparma columacea]